MSKLRSNCLSLSLSLSREQQKTVAGNVGQAQLNHLQLSLQGKSRQKKFRKKRRCGLRERAKTRRAYSRCSSANRTQRVTVFLKIKDRLVEGLSIYHREISINSVSCDKNSVSSLVKMYDRVRMKKSFYHSRWERKLMIARLSAIFDFV